MCKIQTALPLLVIPTPDTERSEVEVGGICCLGHLQPGRTNACGDCKPLNRSVAP